MHLKGLWWRILNLSHSWKIFFSPHFSGVQGSTAIYPRTLPRKHQKAKRQSHSRCAKDLGADLALGRRVLERHLMHPNPNQAACAGPSVAFGTPLAQSQTTSDAAQPAVEQYFHIGSRGSKLGEPCMTAREGTKSKN